MPATIFIKTKKVTHNRHKQKRKRNGKDYFPLIDPIKSFQLLKQEKGKTILCC